MVKDTCKQERKTQLQQAGILQASEETHAKKGKQTAAAALSARRCRDKAAGVQVTYLQDGPRPLPPQQALLGSQL